MVIDDLVENSMSIEGKTQIVFGNDNRGFL